MQDIDQKQLTAQPTVAFVVSTRPWPEPDPSLRSTDGRDFGVIVSARWPGCRKKEYENKRTRFETGRLDLGFVDLAGCWRGRKKMG